jgi:hypothetical protein
VPHARSSRRGVATDGRWAARGWRGSASHVRILRVPSWGARRRAGQDEDIVRGAMLYLYLSLPALWCYSVVECVKRYLLSQARPRAAAPWSQHAASQGGCACPHAVAPPRLRTRCTCALQSGVGERAGHAPPQRAASRPRARWRPGGRLTAAIARPGPAQTARAGAGRPATRHARLQGAARRAARAAGAAAGRALAGAWGCRGLRAQHPTRL